MKIENRQLFSSLIEYSQIPFKNHSFPFNGYAIIPHKDDAEYPDHILEDIVLYKEKIKLLSLQSPDPDVQYKYNSTLKFAEYVTSKFRPIWQSSYWRGKAWTMEINGSTQQQEPPKRINSLLTRVLR